MFLSDRDIRRPSGGGGGPSRKDELVEKARQEREQREKLRLQTANSIIIQRFWRGRYRYYVIIREGFADLQKKMMDLERVTIMLKTTKGIDFVPPMNIVAQMMPSFVFICRKKPVAEVFELVLKFSKFVISPLACEAVPEKNILSYFNDEGGVFSHRFIFCNLIGVLLNALSCHTADRPVADIIKSIRHLLGFNYEASTIISKIHVTARLVILENFYWFQRVRSIMIPFVAPLLKPLVSDEHGMTDVKSLPAFRTAQLICDELFSISLWLIDVSSIVDAKINFYLSQFGRDLFTIPILSTLLSGKTTITMTIWKYKAGIMGRWTSPSLALPPSPHPAFSSGHWLTGNICGLAKVFCAKNIGSSACTIASTINRGTAIINRDISRDDLSIFLSAVVPLLLKYYIPGVLKNARNGGGIVWMRSGVQLVASGIPALLQEQLLQLLDPDFSRSLYMNLLVPLRQDVSTLASPDDKKTVAEALSSNGVRMLKESVIEKTVESNKWVTSKWASKIGQSIARLFTGGSSGSELKSASDFVATSRDTSSPDSGIASLQTFQQPLPETSLSFDGNILASLFFMWSIILPQASLSSLESKSWKNLSSFVFSTRFVDRIWVSIHLLNLQRFEANFEPKDITSQSPSCQITSAIITLAAVLKTVLAALDDSELYEHGYPLPLHQILRLVRCFKVILYKCLQRNSSALVEPADVSVAAAGSSDPLVNQLAVSNAVEAFYKYHALKVIADVLSNLHVRWARRPFSFSDLWEIEDTGSRRFKGELLSNSEFAVSVMTNMPWCINFHQRLVFFRTTVDAERRSIQGSDTDPSFRSMGTGIRIRKTMILEDGMRAMEQLSVSALKDRIVVHYINEFGEEEKGIDAGGLFKDFWSDISNRVFNPSFGLFSVTSSQLLYPNHNALSLYPEDEIDKLYYFVGRVLGKALFENMTVQPQFAHFFLAYINGRYNFVNLIDDLWTFDPELYKNLMFLKSYDGDLADLSLTFSVSDEAYGAQKEIDLVPGGSGMAVTTHNRHRYINLVAKYYLHDRIHIQAGAFFRGLNQVIRSNQLSIFCAPELQVLISGTSSGISVEDLKANTQYAGGYYSVDRTITKFWTTVESLDEEDRALLLKFVTSCERPPSLGFSALQPPFTIQRVDADGDSRLPTASTCFNILKLPSYSSKAVMKEKLLFAIRSGSGFDLS